MSSAPLVKVCAGAMRLLQWSHEQLVFAVRRRSVLSLVLRPTGDTIFALHTFLFEISMELNRRAIENLKRK